MVQERPFLREKGKRHITLWALSCVLNGTFANNRGATAPVTFTTKGGYVLEFSSRPGTHDTTLFTAVLYYICLINLCTSLTHMTMIFVICSTQVYLSPGYLTSFLQLKDIHVRFAYFC